MNIHFDTIFVLLAFLEKQSWTITLTDCQSVTFLFSVVKKFGLHKKNTIFGLSIWFADLVWWFGLLIWIVELV